MSLRQTPHGLQAIDIKSGSTVASDCPQAGRKWASLPGGTTLPPLFAYGGSGPYIRQGCEVAGWCELALGLRFAG